jgi:hypothetical protein
MFSGAWSIRNVRATKPLGQFDDRCRRKKIVGSFKSRKTPSSAARPGKGF